MTPPGTFERVYAAIKQRLRSGAYPPGARLEPAVLADELNASVTPVRDALHRLTGERLVEAPRHEGFRVPMLTETMLRQLYGWHRDLLLLAAMKRQALPPVGAAARAGGDPGASVHDRQNALFLALVRSAGNAEHAAALESLSHRLEPAQRFEQLFIERTEEETAEILRALSANDRTGLRRSLASYHRRRERVVPELLTALLQSGPGSG